MRALNQEEKVALAICFCLIVVELVLLLNIGAEDTGTRYPEIVGLTWSDNDATFTVRHIGPLHTVIVEVRVNGEYAIINPSYVELIPGAPTTITVTRTESFISGVEYEFTFVSASGNIFSYTATAP